jgi:sugar phosphate isomerase/epimerase
MKNNVHRRKFLASLIAAPMLLPSFSRASSYPMQSRDNRLKTSLNAFSFNTPLLEGKMNLGDMLEFCAATGFDGVDITGYYFKGYPEVPPDAYLFEVKRKAFELGLAISGTGVRNDFTIPDKSKRALEVELVKKWIVAAAKIGAPVIRIFAGNQKHEGFTNAQVTAWMLEDIRTCVSYGQQHGVIIGLQNHNDFIQTADEINGIIDAIHSPWLGIILDTGSYRVHDPYAEIEKSITHAVNWQIKEKVFVKGVEVDTDLNRIIHIIRASAYNGYLPIETLGEGDPKTKIITLFERLKKAMV